MQKKWELVIFKKDCFQKCKHQVLAFFLKNQNTVLKYLVSVLKQSFSVAFVVKSGPFYLARALFHPVWALSGPIQTLFYSVRLFFIQAGFLC